MFVDNQTAIRLSSNPSMHARSKHIDIKHHLVRHVEFGTIKLNYIETAKQRADARTGSAAMQIFTFFRLSDVQISRRVDVQV